MFCGFGVYLTTVGTVQRELACDQDPRFFASRLRKRRASNLVPQLQHDLPRRQCRFPVNGPSSSLGLGKTSAHTTAWQYVVRVLEDPGCVKTKIFSAEYTMETTSSRIPLLHLLFWKSNRLLFTTLIHAIFFLTPRFVPPFAFRLRLVEAFVTFCFFYHPPTLMLLLRYWWMYGVIVTGIHLESCPSCKGFTPWTVDRFPRRDFKVDVSPILHNLVAYDAWWDPQQSA